MHSMFNLKFNYPSICSATPFHSSTRLGFHQNSKHLNMSTIVYHGLRSRLESQMMEHRMLKLKLSSPKLSFSQSLEMSLQSHVIVPADGESKKLDNPISPSSNRLCLNTPSHTPCEKLLIDPYVHPSAKHSSSWLSDKSLNLCTENLGSETGSEFIDNSIFSSPTCSNAEIKISKKKVQQPTRNRQVREPKKQFPPPLTTLHGPDSLHVKPHRENGRLILKASSNPTARSCFHVDRSNGRLRLYLADATRHKTEQEEDDN